jgi:hypothetical protein
MRKGRQQEIGCGGLVVVGMRLHLPVARAWTPSGRRCAVQGAFLCARPLLRFMFAAFARAPELIGPIKIVSHRMIAMGGVIRFVNFSGGRAASAALSGVPAFLPMLPHAAPGHHEARAIDTSSYVGPLVPRRGLALGIQAIEIARFYRNPKICYPHGYLACTRFRRHRVRCFNGTGGGSWRGGSLRGSSSLRPCA